jgi:hypothetical protein
MNAGGGSGGAGLQAGASLTQQAGGYGGAASGGDINQSGGPGVCATRLSGTVGYAGNGGSRSRHAGRARRQRVGGGGETQGKGGGGGGGYTEAATAGRGGWGAWPFDRARVCLASDHARRFAAEPVPDNPQ